MLTHRRRKHHLLLSSCWIIETPLTWKVTQTGNKTNKQKKDITLMYIPKMAALYRNIEKGIKRLEVTLRPSRGLTGIMVAAVVASFQKQPWWRWIGGGGAGVFSSSSSWQQCLPHPHQASLCLIGCVTHPWWNLHIDNACVLAVATYDPPVARTWVCVWVCVRV